MKNDKKILMKELYSCWKDSPFPSVKVTSYFPAYVELFSHLVGEKCTFIETGILDGGSLFMWRNWLGENARIIGIDLNPEALKWQNEGFEIFIGDQADPEFWKITYKNIGNFDALLDDGGHQSFQQIITTLESIRACNSNCIVVVEDTATSFMKDFASHGERSFLEYSKSITDILTARISNLFPDRFTSNVNKDLIDEFKKIYSVQFYSGVVAFHLNEDFAQSPKLIRNRPKNGAKDFRYEGLNSAKVNWPNIFEESKTVEIKGSTSL
jgi:hypothetical protein